MINQTLNILAYIPPCSKHKRKETRMFIHNVMIGAASLAMLTIGLHTVPEPQPRLTQGEIIDALAAQIDGSGELYAPLVHLPPPIPARKPSRGYSEEFRANMNTLVARYMEKTQ